MLHFIQRQCLNRPFRLYRALSTASQGTETVNKDGESFLRQQRTPTPRSPYTRSLYVYDLPEDYDPATVVRAIGEEPIHRISLGEDTMYVNFWTPAQASRVLNRTGGILMVQGMDASIRFNKTAQDTLTASSVAHLGIAHTTRALFVFGESVQEKSLEEWRKLALQYGPLESVNFGTQKDNSPFVVITFLSAEHARKAMSGLKHRHTVKYRRDYEAANRPDVQRRVLLSGLNSTLSTTVLTNHILDTIASIGHGEKIIKLSRSGPRIGKARNLFFDSFKTANSNPYGLTVELQSIRPISPSLYQAIYSGANRTIRLYTNKQEIPRTKLMDDLNSMGHIAQVYSKEGIALITFSSIFDALKAVSDLAAGRHNLGDYTGLSVSFSKNDLQAILKPAVIAEPEGINGEEDVEREIAGKGSDPADIIANVMASENSATTSVDDGAFKQILETIPAEQETADVAAESPAKAEPAPPNTST
ncbi:uncharacterized protein EV420DRAFT_1515523 [Desarmillaria tabescens]|uniref:RRM domain-containing protein n=1 Tax=Armillaria tabescens TaxID=1929756 RepID=A0AA39NEN9_ARMTA|nr:uncharacterized protein EV420DRAFT_1515523 [Desarmillaria tabescens]KAK0464240.1 hypothetical protein EV420DRAFT_1515523 [Desarmillaria tabescens]